MFVVLLLLMLFVVVFIGSPPAGGSPVFLFERLAILRWLASVFVVGLPSHDGLPVFVAAHHLSMARPCFRLWLTILRWLAGVYRGSPSCDGSPVFLAAGPLWSAQPVFLGHHFSLVDSAYDCVIVLSLELSFAACYTIVTSQGCWRLTGTACSPVFCIDVP